jgi:hypothetical protein
VRVDLPPTMTANYDRTPVHACLHKASNMAMKCGSSLPPGSRDGCLDGSIHALDRLQQPHRLNCGVEETKQSHEVPSFTTTKEPRIASRKRVHWAPMSTPLSQTVHCTHGILHASQANNYMTTPFTVAFRLGCNTYIVRLSSFPMTHATLGNFEETLFGAVPAEDHQYLCRYLKTQYQLRLHRILGTATAAIGGDGNDRQAAFNAFLNVVYRDATVCLVWG